MAAFALFALLRILADRPEQQFRWEVYATASLIGAVFVLAVTRALSSQAEKVAALEGRVASLESTRSTNKKI